MTDRDLADAWRVHAGWLEMPRTQDAADWVARAAVNQPEIDLLRQAPLPPDPMYRAEPTAVATPMGHVPRARRAGTVPEALTPVLARAHGVSHLNVFNTLLPEAQVEPTRPGYLHGMPVVIKDLMAVRGLPLTGGTRARPAVQATEDAAAVARLKAHGARVIGTTNLHELAFGITSANPHRGAVVNPHAPGHIPGGSSGGTAAAIAAGVVRAGLGTDTAGSVRIPAACCGVVGFKPSFDAVPRTGVLDLGPTLDHVGPLAASVADCADVFAALLDLPSRPAWLAPSARGVRVGRLRGYFDEPLDPSVRQALDQAVEALRGEGAVLSELELDGVEQAAAIQFHTLCAEATAVNADVMHGQGLGDDVRLRLAIGAFLPGAWYVKAQRMRQALVRRMNDGFAQADFWITSCLRTPAPPVGAAEVDIGGRRYPLHTAVTQLTMPFNLSGLPAISLPWGRDVEGLPLAIQIIGPRGADWGVLALAERLERAAPPA